MDPIIKWPGGKSREIRRIEGLIPQFDRYIEPFFGGGAVFFHLAPRRAAINDVSPALIDFYRLIKEQDPALPELLTYYCAGFDRLVHLCEEHSQELNSLFLRLREGTLDRNGLRDPLEALVRRICAGLGADFRAALLREPALFEAHLVRSARDKLLRTVANDRKKPFSPEDLRENLLTGFTGGFYMYFRQVFNDLSLGRGAGCSRAYAAANFYFIREYCYGSMFRYNAQGEFNIPYGGMSYNRKDLRSKIENIFSPDVRDLFANTDIHCGDFQDFLEGLALTPRDFIFLDPPYDTDFSDYEGRAFTRRDQERLAETLRQLPAQMILVIKNTEFIHNLYARDFSILRFDKQYAYNVRSRNDRDVEHLIITNLPVPEQFRD